MTSITKTQKKRKSELTIEYSRGDDGAPVHVSITAPGDKQSSDYWVELIPADFGIGLKFKKVWNGRTKDFDFTEYDVNIDTLSWCHTCECRGHLKTGENCRHIRAAIKLLDDGVLTLPPRPIVDRREPEYVEEVPEATCRMCGCLQSWHGGENNEFCPI